MDKNNILKVFPCVYFIAFLTYSLILFIEKVAFDSHSLLDGSFEEGQEHDHDHNHDDFGNHKKVEEKKSKIELKTPKENQEKCKKFILLFIF